MVSKFPWIGEADLLLVNSRISEQLEKDEEYTTQANKLRNCSQFWNTFMCDCGFHRFAKRCYYKICPKCGKIRAMDLFNKYIGVLKTKRIARSIYDKGLRFLTLTIKNQKSQSEAREKLYSAFKKLRNREYWGERVKGGVAGFHVKRGKDGLWNAHLHIILDSSYLDMKSTKRTKKDSLLVQEWKHCTGGDGIIDIIRVRTHEGALNYILNYVSSCAFELSDEDKILFFKETFKKRLFFSFGKKSEGIYGLKFLKKRRACPDCGCLYQYIIPLTEEWELAQIYFEKNKPPPKDLNDYSNIIERGFN